MPLAYTWQCEFRSKWIWRHPGLANYKYMMWMDSDTMCSKPWKQDPIATMVRNDLVLMYDNYPQVCIVHDVHANRKYFGMILTAMP